jgi:3-oxoacyl-[acyl-carrier-protein] synthase III
MSRAVAISGWGAALPPTVVTNHDMEARFKTTDEWIVERTGIRSRHIGAATSELAAEAGRRALESAGVDAADVDLLVVSTSTPDRAVPPTSVRVHHQLGLGGGAFDLNAACSGFVYALVACSSMVKAGAEKALVIGSDVMSRITWTDRSTAVLFADGAGAVVLEASAGDDMLISQDLGIDGSAEPLIYCEHGGQLHMEGQEVFRRAVRIVVESVGTTLERAKLTVDDIDLFVPHQANRRIIEAANNRLGISMERTLVSIDHTGNTSSASVPIALAEAADSSRLKPGDVVLLSGFGAGMTWASALVRWGP